MISSLAGHEICKGALMKILSKPRILLEIAIVLAVMLGIKDIADRLEFIGAGSIAMWCGIVSATLFMRKHDTSWKDLGLGLPVGWKSWLKSIGMALVTVVAIIAFMALVLPIITKLIGVDVPPEATDRFAFLLGKPIVFITYLVVVIWFGAALGEELLMRGFLLNYLAALFGQDRAGWLGALVVHSIIFGMLHIYQGIPGVIATGIVAMILGSVYLLVKRRLFPVILAHGLINTISITGYYLTDGALT
jgi:membrane protease YdiL (CAAX protease family)